MGISGAGGIVAGGPVFSDSTTSLNKIGARFRDERHDRTYRYALCASGAALVAGNVIQHAAEDIQNRNCAPGAAAAIGDTSISVTLGTTAAGANKFAGGLAIISTTVGLGYSYGISGHPALTASVAGTVYLDEAVQVALATGTSKIDLQEHPYSNVIQAPQTTASGAPVGVATYIISASQYGWLQTWGPCGVLIDGTPAVGAMVVSVGAAAGGATIFSSTLPVIGRMMALGVSGKCKAVYLTIAN